MLQRIFSWCKKILKAGVQWVENKVLQQTRPSQVAVVVGTAADVDRSRAELIAENALLRQQLVVLRRSVKRPKLTDTDRRLLVVLARWVSHWRDTLLIVKPDTLLDWHRQLFKLVWRHKSAVAPENHRCPMRRSHSSRKWRATTSVGAPKESAANCSRWVCMSVSAPSRNICATPV